MFFNARYFSPYLNRWIQPDSIVPEAGNPQALNRYSYVANNPLKYIDPSGHCWGFASGLRNTGAYGTTCNNIDMALTIVTHPEETFKQEDGARAYVLASAYLVGEGTAHVVAAVYGGIAACGLASAACYKAVQGGVGCILTNCVDKAQRAVTAVEGALPAASQEASALINELSRTGAKFNPDQIVRITRATSGQITWLERGGSEAGLEHIVARHASDFAARGISTAEIPDALMAALNQGTVVGQVKDGLIYQFVYNGTVQNVLMVVGSNGYIVTAHPITP
jgi:hypothetical protein